MPKKIILDVDPGIVDAMVLCLAIFDPKVEIAAITSVGGNVPAPVAAKNLQALIEFIDPPKIPRLGFGSPPDEPIAQDYRHVHGIDGLGGTPLPVAELRVSRPADKVICDAVRSDPGNVTIVCLGPLTNIARAVQREPKLPEMIQHIYITGGSLNGQGNITPCAEFNIYADVQAAKTVFRLPCMKTLVPLNITNPISFTLGHLNQCPPSETKLGQLLRSMIPPALQVYRQSYGLEGIHIHDLVTYMIAVNPSWAKKKDIPVQIETEGLWTRGMTAADMRPHPDSPPNIEVVTKINAKAVMRAVLQGLAKNAEIIG